jgi:predicted flap endonuclease-1-like 5' DNA nuclease
MTMDNNQGMINCALGTWLVALLAGILAAVLLMLLGGWSFMQGAFIGAVLFGAAGLLLSVMMCRPLPALGEVTASETDEEEAPAAKAPAPAAPAAAAAPATAAAEVKPSAPLAGQEELAARKGEWKYEGDAPDAAPAKKPAAKKPAAKKPAAKEADPAPAADGPGKKPETLSAAREGGPDNLKQIKGVGPKLEALLHSMGFYHFDQIGSWGADEIAWVDQNLEGFKGRVSRDEWVAQAKILADGGTTAFSSKVKKGGVY